MQGLVQEKEQKMMAEAPGEFELGPVLDKMGHAHERDEQPNLCLVEIRPRHSCQAGRDEQDVEGKAFQVFYLPGMEGVKLQDEITDQMPQDKMDKKKNSGVLSI